MTDCTAPATVCVALDERGTPWMDSAWRTVEALAAAQPEAAFDEFAEFELCDREDAVAVLSFDDPDALYFQWLPGEGQWWLDHYSKRAHHFFYRMKA